MRGTVRWLNNQKGYGFVEAEDGTEIFKHYSGINSTEEFKTVKEGKTVEFDVIDTEKGKQAINVTPIEEEK